MKWISGVHSYQKDGQPVDSGKPAGIAGGPAAFPSPERPPDSRFWSPRRHWGKAAVAAIALGVLAPKTVNGQLPGLDTAAILAALTEMESMMKQFIASPLSTINAAEQSLNSYNNQVIYPSSSITQAQGSVSQAEGQFQQISGLSAYNTSSATLPQSQSLEKVLLSRDTANAPAVSTQYQTVYGPVMPANTAAPQVRAMTDIADAQAQDAMKRAVEIDQLSDAELDQASKLGEQIAVAAPGSAPILEAEADVWLIRANAFTMEALAELTRTRSIDIASQGGVLKVGTAQTTAVTGYMNSTLNR